MRHHQPARSYNSVDFHFTPGQQMSRAAAVFDKSGNRISSPPRNIDCCPVFDPQFSRASAISFLSFFLFSLAFEAKKDRGDRFFIEIHFHFVSITFLFLEWLYNKDRRKHNFWSNNVASKKKKKKRKYVSTRVFLYFLSNLSFFLFFFCAFERTKRNKDDKRGWRSIRVNEALIRVFIDFSSRLLREFVTFLFFEWLYNKDRKKQEKKIFIHFLSNLPQHFVSISFVHFSCWYINYTSNQPNYIIIRIYTLYKNHVTRAARIIKTNLNRQGYT